MKKTLTILIALVMTLSLALPAFAEGNAARQKVTIRFAQYGNSTDDVEGMEKPCDRAVRPLLTTMAGTFTALPKRNVLPANPFFRQKSPRRFP